MDASLKIIKQRLQSILKQLEWSSENIAGNQGLVDRIKLTGLANIRNVINEIRDLGLFEDIVGSLSNSVIYTTANDQMTVQLQEARDIIASLNLLSRLNASFLNVLLATVPEEDVNSINIKLPPINDFDELSKVSREIHLGLTQVIYNEDINGQTKIVSVENGSIWINVFVGANAVAIIASLVWASAVIYKKIQEGKLLAEQVRGLKVKNESLEDILKAQKAETQTMIEAEASHIQSEYFRNNAPENIEKIKNSISIFADLIGRGAEIQPALIAPENVSNLFPDPKNIIGLESRIKRIGS